jgi:hypothetical protein
MGDNFDSIIYPCIMSNELINNKANEYLLFKELFVTFFSKKNVNKKNLKLDFLLENVKN